MDNITSQTQLSISKKIHKHLSLSITSQVKTRKVQTICFIIAKEAQTNKALTLAIQNHVTKSQTFQLNTEVALIKQISLAFKILENTATTSHLTLAVQSRITKSQSHKLSTEVALIKQISLAFKILENTATTSHLTLAMESQIAKRQTFQLNTERLVTSSIRLSINSSKKITKSLRIHFIIQKETRVTKLLSLPFIAAERPIIIIKNNNYALYRNKRIGLLDFEISQDWDTYLWQGRIRPAHHNDYALTKVGEEIKLILQEKTYSLIINQRSHSDKEGMATFIIQVCSPAIKLEQYQISKTWPTMKAKAICEELALKENIQISWKIIDWQIEHSHLIASKNTPIEIIRRIAEAAGGIAQSQADGSLQIQYKTPIALNKLHTVPPNHIYNDKLHILSYSESSPSHKKYNAVIITNGIDYSDSDQKDFQFFAQYFKIDEYNGILRVHSEPWTSKFHLTHTGHSSIQINRPTIVYRQEIEQIEFKKGMATLAYPINELVSYEWRHKNSGIISWENDQKELSLQSTEFGLAVITYKTRALEFPIYHQIRNLETHTQFLVEI